MRGDFKPAPVIDFQDSDCKRGTSRISHLLEMLERVKVRARRTLPLATHRAGRSHVSVRSLAGVDSNQMERGVERVVFGNCKVWL